MRTRMTLALAAVLLPLLASAGEIAPGTIQVSGFSMLGLQSATSNETTTSPGAPSVTVKTDISTFDLDAGALYYVTNMVGVGLDLGYGSQEEKTWPDTVTTTDLFIGPKVGVDVGVAEKLAVFGDAAVGYVKESYESTDATDPTATVRHEPTGWGLRIGAGVKYFPVKSLSLDAGLGYSYKSVSFTRTVETVDTSTGGFGGRLGISIYFGN